MCRAHNGAGPSFVLVLIDLAEARHVHAAATTRTAVLTARFIVFLLTCGSPGSGNPSGWIIPVLSSNEGTYWRQDVYGQFIWQ